MQYAIVNAASQEHLIRGQIYPVAAKAQGLPLLWADLFGYQHQPRHSHTHWQINAAVACSSSV